jgi:hypothetical protein
MGNRKKRIDKMAPDKKDINITERLEKTLATFKLERNWMKIN